MKTLLTIVIALAIPVAAQATTKYNHAQQAANQQRIACTDVGCLPISSNCHPAGGKTLSGLPTGYDVVVCPNGTSYGHQ
jgi:hypothetical protein